MPWTVTVLTTQNVTEQSFEDLTTLALLEHYLRHYSYFLLLLLAQYVSKCLYTVST